MVRPRGTLALQTTFEGQNEVNLTSIVVYDASLVGSRCGPVKPALRPLSMGLLDAESRITATYPLDEAVEAVQKARSRVALKVLVRP
jgi:threonine dehydrogenase-like Zn-dependent dehydrogenase